MALEPERRGSRTSSSTATSQRTNDKPGTLFLACFVLASKGDGGRRHRHGSRRARPRRTRSRPGGIVSAAFGSRRSPTARQQDRQSQDNQNLLHHRNLQERARRESKASVRPSDGTRTDITTGRPCLARKFARIRTRRTIDLSELLVVSHKGMTIAAPLATHSRGVTPFSSQFSHDFSVWSSGTGRDESDGWRGCEDQMFCDASSKGFDEL